MRNVLIAIIVLVLLFFVFAAGIGIGFMFSGEDGFASGEGVAVLRIDNVILDSQAYLESLEAIRDDESIKALVVRINSPGGAVSPSQEVFNEIKDIAQVKPVIASIGTVGASGGYYIACAAQKILANPGSITGSIGVIAYFVDYRELLDWAKVDVEVIKSGKFKDVGSPVREMSEAERQYLQELLDSVHSQFKIAVSKSRGIPIEKVNQLADGRIFTGEQAKRLNLVDEIGTINDAIRLAADLGGIEEEDPDVIYYPQERMNLLDFVLSNLKVQGLSRSLIKESFGLFYLADIMQ